jgi:hypothetical protein
MDEQDVRNTSIGEILHAFVDDPRRLLFSEENAAEIIVSAELHLQEPAEQTLHQLTYRLNCATLEYGLAWQHSVMEKCEPQRYERINSLASKLFDELEQLKPSPELTRAEAFLVNPVTSACEHVREALPCLIGNTEVFASWLRERRPRGRPKEAKRARFIVALAKAYKEATGTKAGVSRIRRTTGGRKSRTIYGGPFVRFAILCLKRIGEPGQESELASAVEAAMRSESGPEDGA